MLRELAHAAQHVATDASSEGTNHQRNTKIAEDLARFWAVAPLPTKPGALRQAATEACAGITGKRDGNYDITNGQRALLSRAKTCLAILKTIPEQTAAAASLEAMIEEKNRLLNPVWHKNPKVRFWLVVVIVVGLLCIPVLIMANKGQSESELRDGIRSFAGAYSNGYGATLQISDASIAVSIPGKVSNTVKIVLEGNQNLVNWSSWDGSTFAFKTRVKSAFSLNDDDQKECQGSISRVANGIQVTVAGNTTTCEGFNGRWTGVQRMK